MNTEQEVSRELAKESEVALSEITCLVQNPRVIAVLTKGTAMDKSLGQFTNKRPQQS
jgi:hypothetical protein